MVQSFAIEMLVDYRAPRLLDLKEHGFSQFIHHQQNQTASPDAADAHYLEGEVLSREMFKKRAAVMTKRFHILGEHALDQRLPVSELDPVIVGSEQCVGAVYV